MNNPRIFSIGIIILSLILGVMFYCFIPLFSVPGIEKALDGILLLSSISLGFYGACLGILASIFNTTAVKEIMKDSDYRKEFIQTACFSLISGFCTVISTIVYQVFLSNEYVTVNSLKIMNATWAFLTVSFFMFQAYFVIILFLIFFNNSDVDVDQNRSVFTPKLND